jgi:hypothetical protein
MRVREAGALTGLVGCRALIPYKQMAEHAAKL